MTAFRYATVTTLAAFALMCAATAEAADHTVEMLNNGASGSMVFEPAFVRAAVGDTIVFKPTQSGAHYSVTVSAPEGAPAWHGEPDKEYRVKLEKEGVYLYACEPHRIMGMVGVVQVGKPVNLAAAKAIAAKDQATWVMNKDRFDKALALVK